MTRITKPLRGQRGARNLDLTEMRAALASPGMDTRTWAAIGVTVAPQGGGPHWEVVGDNADVMVEVEIQPTQELVTCRIAAGMWIVPALGEEVVVILPAGELDFMPTIVAILAGAVPETQGPALNRIVIVRGQVLVHDGSGGAVPLAYKTDVEAVDNKYKDHIHLSPMGGTGGPLSTVVLNVQNPGVLSDPAHPFLDEHGTPTANPEHAGGGLAAANIEGTQVLLAK